MTVREIRHAARCKFCRHPKVADINAILLRVSKRELSRDEAIAQIAELGVENPGAGDGWKHHWSSKGHYFYETPAQAAETAEQREKEEGVRKALTEAALDCFNNVLGEDWRERGVSPSAEQILEVQRGLYVHELELRLAAGLPSGITHDQVLKSIGEATKRKQNEAQGELLKALGGGISQVFEKALGGGEKQAELPAGEQIIIVEDVPEEDIA